MDKLYKDYSLFAKSNCNIGSNKLDSYTNIINRGVSPTIIEERRLNVASMDVFSRMMMDRIIFLGGEVTPETCDIINSQLLYLDSIGEDDIKLYINTPGGSVDAGLATYDIMNYINSDVQTVCMGLCASMGSIILSSGEKGKRFILPHGRVMIHQPSWGVKGMASDIKIVADEIERRKRELYQILSDNTGKPIEQLYKDGDRDYWLNAKEALDYGLVDEIITKKVD